MIPNLTPKSVFQSPEGITARLLIRASEGCPKVMSLAPGGIQDGLASVPILQEDDKDGDRPVPVYFHGSWDVAKHTPTILACHSIITTLGRTNRRHVRQRRWRLNLMMNKPGVMDRRAMCPGG